VTDTRNSWPHLNAWRSTTAVGGRTRPDVIRRASEHVTEGSVPQTSTLSSNRHWLLALVTFALYPPSLSTQLIRNPNSNEFSNQNNSTANMKFAAVVALLAAAAAAVPTGLERRQFGGMTENELKSGSCKKITLVYARGSTEMGNMVCIPISPTRQICYPSSS